MFSIYTFPLCVLDILTEEAKQISIHRIWLEAQNYAHLETLSITWWILATVGQSCTSLCSLYIVIIIVYIKMECPWPNASKFTRAVLNLSWRIFFFFFLKQKKKFNMMLFSSYILFASTFVVGLDGERADSQIAA